LNTLSEMGTWFAETIPVLVLLLVAIAIAWRVSRAIAAPVFLAVVVGGEKLIYLIVSLVVGRERPPVPTLGDTYATHSFPSGHIASAITLYGGIALVIALQRSAAVRRTLLVVVAVISVVVGLCRMYRGFHYPTDVMAGTVLGVVWLIVVYVTVLVGRRLRPGSRADSSGRGAV
jgi:membrane-associated phospholipid phosphatase